ncbi:MAG: hypothetical protein M0016_06370 [Deltaproteobacteria bacterium]|jgi:hypothetical protein|nr:hypothetical protein [Deltaproteobacteria bacterium]MCL5880181.1 hypothetical protein [Deltaproteobacteria bacterium]MDA8304769.1 hypothetical protein [Deltaproteobacteria bacterium]
MKKKLVITMVALFVLALSFAMAPKKANAIPAFAQKYHFSCAVCHTVFPNLNPFGRAFWRNGFRLPGTNGTPSDATQITEGLSLPNPWPVPIMVEGIITYQHYTNENVSNAIPQQTDAFGIDGAIVTGGAFKLYTPLADSLSFYTHWTVGGNVKLKQVFASLNGLGTGFGLPSHLFNLKLGQVTTASPYFYRQAPFYLTAGPVQNGQGLAVGYDTEAGNLIHKRNAGFALYGTPGYHLWYKVSVTNDAGGSTVNANSNTTGVSNAMEYSYQLKEYAPIPMGQLEFGYYGASISQPLYNAAIGAWNTSVQVNGVDVDLANDIYELGLTYMQQRDNHPYGPNGITFNGNTQNSNGYDTFEVYGRYLFPQIGNGLMLSADYAAYSWTHKDAQEAYNGNNPGASCSNASLYQSGTYTSSNGCTNEGIKDAFAINAEYNLAYNAHLYLGYLFTNKSEDNTVGAGLDFAF